MCKFLQIAITIAASLHLIVTAGAQTNLGSVNLGSSSTATATITLSGAVTLSSIDVVTRGASGLDFTSAGTGTCHVGTAYTAGQTCTVGVNFKPLYAGNRYGAVLLYSSGGIVGNGFLQGYGLGPQVAFNPSPVIAIDPPVPGINNSTGLNYDSGVAVDGTGNLYITSSNINGVVRVAAGTGAYSVVDPATEGNAVSFASGVAVDGAGDLFLVDESQGRVVELRPDGSTAQLSDSGAIFPGAIAVAADGAGNAFLLNQANGHVVEYTFGSYPVVQNEFLFTVDGKPLVNPLSLAVDASGNLFISDTDHIVELTAAQVAGGGNEGTVIAPTVDGKVIYEPFGIAFDSIGDMFIADLGNNRIVVVPTTGAAYAIQPVVNGIGLSAPASLAFDDAGDLFIADSLNYRVVELQRSKAPKLSFAVTAPGSTSTDSPQTVQVQSVGTTALSITGVSYPPDFPEHTAGSDPCPNAGSLSSGQTCNLKIDFAPASAGFLSESVTLTDNNLNVNGAKQVVGVSGTGGSGQLLLSATSVSFGQQIVGTSSASQQVTLTNATTSPVSIDALQITGTGPSAFIFGNSCPPTLAAGASCIIHGHFSPPAPIPYSAVIIIDYRGGASQSITLSGEGANPPTEQISIGSLSFGTLQVGKQSVSKTFTLTNQGQGVVAPLPIVGIQVTGPNASSFIFGSDCPAALQPQSSCTIHGHFAPTATGPLTASVTILAGDHLGSVSIPLTGTGTSQPAAFVLDSNSLAFGTQPIGTPSSSQGVVLFNYSNVSVPITSVKVTGANASSFVFASSCGASVAPGSACTIHGHFTPVTSGFLTASVVILDQRDSFQQTITLSGTGQ